MAAAFACYSDPAELEAWASAAAPGETFVFAIADRLDPANPVMATLERLAAEGAIVPVAHRNDEARARCVLRCPDAARGQSLSDLPRLAPDFSITPEGQLFLLLIQLAEAGEVCPTNAELARRLGWGDRQQARYRLDRLAEGGWITVRGDGRAGHDRPRIVTIVETGKTTSSCAPSDAGRPASAGLGFAAGAAARGRAGDPADRDMTSKQGNES